MWCFDGVFDFDCIHFAQITLGTETPPPRLNRLSIFTRQQQIIINYRISMALEKCKMQNRFRYSISFFFVSIRRTFYRFVRMVYFARVNCWRNWPNANRNPAITVSIQHIVRITIFLLLNWFDSRHIFSPFPNSQFDLMVLFGLQFSHFYFLCAFSVQFSFF